MSSISSKAPISLLRRDRGCDDMLFVACHNAPADSLRVALPVRYYTNTEDMQAAPLGVCGQNAVIPCEILLLAWSSRRQIGQTGPTSVKPDEALGKIARKAAIDEGIIPQDLLTGDVKERT